MLFYPLRVPHKSASYNAVASKCPQTFPLEAHIFDSFAWIVLYYYITGALAEKSYQQRGTKLIC